MAETENGTGTEEVKTAAAAQKEQAAEARLEIVVAIFLGITALLMAWSSWIGSLHGGNQATNYSKSNNLSAEGNADWNQASQNMMQDMLVWNSIMDYQFDVEIAEMNGKTDEAELINDKIEKLMYDNCSENMLDAIIWAADQEEDVSPFDKEDFIDSYYADAEVKLAEAQELLEQGMQDNTNGDKFGLVSVLYSLALFLLGIVGIFKKLPNRVLLTVISVIIVVLSTIYMFTIPMPTGFDFLSYFKA